MSKRALLFMNSSQRLASVFCNDACLRQAEALGFALKIPARDGDLVDPDWPALAAECEGLVTTWKSPVCSKELLSRMPGVKIVGHAAGSVVAVADESTFDAGVAVVTANPVMAEAVAEWSLLVTLMAVRNLPAYARCFGRGAVSWEQGEDMGDLRRATVGIWGMGDIARHFLEYLKPLRPGRVLVHSRHAGAEALKALGAEKAETLEDLLAVSDVFHCLAGMNRENLRRIDAKALALLKPGAAFVNAGRARLADGDALLAALGSGRIRGYLDVFEEEPLPSSSPLGALDNVLLTPHNAGFPGRERYLSFLLDEFEAFFAGRPTRSGVDLKRFRTMTDETLR